MTDSDSLNSALRRNIAALRHWREQEEADSTFEERVANRITRFTGSMRFVYLHALIYGIWIVANLGVIPGVRPWDPTFVILAMIASVEAIFLSTFILITQNRMSAASVRRAELDVQISLLAEAEITMLVKLVAEIAERLGIPQSDHPEMEEMKRMIAPETVLDVIDDSLDLEEAK